MSCGKDMMTGRREGGELDRFSFVALVRPRAHARGKDEPSCESFAEDEDNETGQELVNTSSVRRFVAGEKGKKGRREHSTRQPARLPPTLASPA